MEESVDITVTFDPTELKDRRCRCGSTIYLRQVLSTATFTNPKPLPPTIELCICLDCGSIATLQ